ncbi:MAG: glycosyltransferase [Bacteroidia bacterium]|nr:glycosyltransferase [Bacteroidia bacterium]
MPALVFICVVISIVFFTIQLVSFIALQRGQNASVSKPEFQPTVSLLLAARNEEKLILRSLNAIDELDYPSDKLEVLIGNDNSSDNTRLLVEDFIRDKPHFRLFDIDSNMGKGRGKANVLAHLAHQAKGEYYFITDVDVKLPKLWIRSLLGQFHPKVGIVSGTSTCEPDASMFSYMQSIDWLHFMGYIQSFANIGVACTSVGNNMAVRAEAYWQTGGYENIDFSITEDYKLFKEVTSRGWDWSTILNPESLGLAWHIDSIKEMLHQRKRWLIGARELPANWKFLIILYGLFAPALITLLIVSPVLGVAIWLTKFAVQSLYIRALCSHVGLKPYTWLNLLWYEFYVLMNTMATAVFYFLPIASIWKGRKYRSDDLI